MATVEHFLDKYLAPVTETLSPQAARSILDLQPQPEVVSRVAELGEKSDGGTLTDAERDEYRALADAGTLVALLKAKARRAMSRHSAWSMNARMRQQVRLRAGQRCECCGLPDAFDEWPFRVDHILARVHGGSDALDILSWSCTQCNLHKASNFASVDSLTGSRVDLFNPRRESWRDHFAVNNEGPIMGLTASGRATVRLLDMNGSPQVDLRRELIAQGDYPLQS